jgi:hypothetical protein
MNTTFDIDSTGRALMSLQQFGDDAWISNVTAWRWRRRGWLLTVNICGRQYATDKGLVEFMRRTETGEFPKKPVVPGRSR